MRRLIRRKLSDKCLKVNALRAQGMTHKQICEAMGFKSFRSTTQYLDEYEQALYEQTVMWDYLCHKLKKLDDNNYTARLIFDQFYK